MPASPKAVPPDAPVVVAYLPDAAMEVKMFSTDCAVSDVQLSHALLKTPFEMLDGFQLANTSAEKSVSDEQLIQAKPTLLTKGSSALKLASDEQFCQACAAFKAEGSAVLKLVSDEQ